MAVYLGLDTFWAGFSLGLRGLSLIYAFLVWIRSWGGSLFLVGILLIGVVLVLNVGVGWVGILIEGFCLYFNINIKFCVSLLTL
ncbi:TPA: hypothetical protein VJO64_001776 [Streptococcus pyogenes]|nr:hypothetical protein [Streptococcus pyogenes]